jgi:hypothetical protein
MMDTERGGFEEQPRHQFNSTQIFAGPNDGLSQTQNGVSTFVGLQGHSSKAGYRVIFPTLDMGRYVEIAEADILEAQDLSPSHSPFGALGGTRVSVREAARILTSRTVSPTPEVDDEFDLDIRLEASAWGTPGVGAVIYAPGIEGGGIQAMAEEPDKKHHTHGEHSTCHTCQTCATVCPEPCKPHVTEGQNSCCKANTCV